MKFPLCILSDFFSDRGFKVIRAPAKQQTTFDWVFRAGESPLPIQETWLVVASEHDTLPDANPAVIVCPYPLAVDRDNAFVLEETEESPSSIAASLQLYLLDIYRWIENMHYALANACSCEQLLQFSEPILKNYLGVTDSTFTLIAHTPGIEPIEDASRYLIAHGTYSPEVLSAINRSRLAEKWDQKEMTKIYTANAINPRPSIEHVYHLGSQYAAHLVMVSPQPITQGQAFLFSLLIDSVGTFLNNQWRRDNPIKQRYTDFLANLLQGQQTSRELIEQQARVLDFPVEGVFKMCVVASAWKGGSSEYFATRVLSLIPECKVIVDGDNLVVMLCIDSRQSKNRLFRLEEQLFTMVENLETQVGMSRKFFSLFGAPAAFIEAKVALTYGKIHHKDFAVPNGVNEDERMSYIYRFKRYFPFFIADPDADQNSFLRKCNLARQILGDIEEEDELHGTNDLTILRIYLYSGNRISAVCSSLDMHRNSVSYRLKHLEEVYDLRLNNADEASFLRALFQLPR